MDVLYDEKMFPINIQSEQKQQDFMDKYNDVFGGVGCLPWVTQNSHRR